GGGAGPAARTSLAWDASPRTRLTHSLECAQVGRELGAALGCDPDLVEVACLAHDLGHPPFGHNGEQVLNDFAKDCGGFEGNAQSLRLLTRIEPKRFVRAGEVAGGTAAAAADAGELVSVGLNLTRAVLDAATKYPWPRGAHPTDPASGKFGVYEDDLPVFDWLRQSAPPHRQCFEAQVMDWSDDVAYSVHDVEDAVASGRLDLRRLRDGSDAGAVLSVAATHFAPDLGRDAVGAGLERLLATGAVPTDYDGSRVALAGLKDMTSRIIGRFVHAAEAATRAVHGPGDLGRYDARLVVPDESRAEVAVLKAVAAHFVMFSGERDDEYAHQRRVVADLVQWFTADPEARLDADLRPDLEAAPDDAARLRVVVDQVAGLTDVRALALHAAHC
ncbi:MAG TPA: deoxyguanosinetriphosphate triphosphohydrolase, partial [Janibacter terrae]|nr:deoxyguanosinetriphosphate triphosphohydrolase [Janibacter terrae]